MKTINQKITQTSAIQQIRKRKYANDENEKENNCAAAAAAVSPFLVKSFHQNKE